MSNELITALLDARRYPDPTDEVTLVETHISWVLLAGDYVYKIKKPVNFGFLDFSTLDKRRFYCAEELRLNRRFAPDIYLDVVPITGSVNDPRFGDGKDIIDYALKMRRFDDRDRLDRLLARDAVSMAQIEAFATAVANAHRSAEVAPADSPHVAVSHRIQPALDNFTHLRPLITDAAPSRQLVALEQWTQQHSERLAPIFEQRARNGAIRECHGDLHTENLAWWHEQPLMFDCIEFNADLRWIDVMSDLAFLMMDLRFRGHADFAHRFLNVYLSATGDYGGLRVLRYFETYRAMVRAKVATLRATQPDISNDDALTQRVLCGAYLTLALQYTRIPTPRLALMFGLSGSGKSVVAQSLADRTGAIVLRSDVERKRLFGLAPMAASGSTQDQGIYTASAHDATHQRLYDLARDIIRSGYTPIIDATFLKHTRRATFAQLAHELGVPVTIVSCHAPEAVLRQRVRARSAAANDASEATEDVLQQQLNHHDPLTDDERAITIDIDTAAPWDADALAARLT